MTSPIPALCSLHRTSTSDRTTLTVPPNHDAVPATPNSFPTHDTCSTRCRTMETSTGPIHIEVFVFKTEESKEPLLGNALFCISKRQGLYQSNQTVSTNPTPKLYSERRRRFPAPRALPVFFLLSRFLFSSNPAATNSSSIVPWITSAGISESAKRAERSS